MVAVALWDEAFHATLDQRYGLTKASVSLYPRVTCLFCYRFETHGDPVGPLQTRLSGNGGSQVAFSSLTDDLVVVQTLRLTMPFAVNTHCCKAFSLVSCLLNPT